MNLIHTLLLIVLFSSAYGQDYTVSQLNASDKITLDANSRFRISGLVKDEEKIYFIKGETGNRLKSGKLAKDVLTFDLFDTLQKNPQAVFALVSPGNAAGFPIENAPDAGNNPVPSGNTDKTIKANIDSYTGIAFWDANLVYKGINKDTCSKITITKLALEIIAKYQGKDDVDWNLIKENPFFQDLTCNKASFFASQIKIRGSIAKTESVGAAKLLGSLSGIDVTKFVQAFADFLKERIKEELTIAYIEKLKALLNDIEELKYLIPKTYHVFTTNDVLSIPSMGPVYKEAFAEDLDNLVDNFENMVFSLKKYENLRDSEGFIAFMLAYHFADLSAKGYHPSDILSTIDKRYGFKEHGALKTSYALSVLNMLSSNLRDVNGDGWINKRDLNLLNKDFMNLFFGLLYEKNKDLFEKPLGNTTLTKIIQAGTNITDKVYDLLVIAKNIDSRITEFKEMKASGAKETVLSLFLNNADELAELVDNIMTLTGIKVNNLAEFQKWKSIILTSVEVAKGIRENNIGKVSINAISVIAQILPDNDDNKKLIRKLTDFTKFISDIASAETSEDVKAVLHRYAAPIRSYRSARINKFSVTLNSYPGFYFGLESNSTTNKLDRAFGVTAPIGFAFNWGNSKESSTSLYVNLIDIGAALSYRWNNDTTDLPQKIELGQIFSPGLFMIYGFKNSPLCLKVGAQYAPLLRKIKDGQNEVSEASVVRYSIGLSVDIPVFILSRKEKK